MDSQITLDYTFLILYKTSLEQKVIFDYLYMIHRSTTVLFR